MKDDIKGWCSECLACQQSKIGRHTKKPIADLPFPTNRFTHVHMDIVGPLESPETSDSMKPRYLLTIIDSYTRWLEAVPLTDVTASTVCQAFLANWIARFGPPLNLTTDKGSQFCSELAENLNQALGINHIRTSAYNPRANGVIERSHRTLKTALKARGRYWLHQLPVVLLGLRMRPDEDGTCAFSRLTGEQPLVPHIVPSNFNLTELSIALHKLPFSYKPPRSVSRAVHMPESQRLQSSVASLGSCKTPIRGTISGAVRRSAKTRRHIHDFNLR